jgi:outer membrane lipoprotein-sorting protein
MVFLTALAGSVAHAQTVDEVIARNLQARGGVEKLRGLNSIRTTGSVEQEGRKFAFVTYAKRPNFMRRELEGTPPPGGPGRASIPATSGPVKAIMAFDGQTAWTINPLMGPAPQVIPRPPGEAAKADADFDSPLLDYKAKGHKVELLGRESVAGKPAHHLKITLKNGSTLHYYLDVETGLEVRTATPLEQGGAKTELTADLSNYQTIDGLTVPFRMRQSIGSTQVADVTISKWEPNVPMDDELFKMPSTK